MTVDYTHDAVGNRLTQESMVSGLPSTVSYNYDHANRLETVNGITYTWDNNGNLLDDGSSTYTYDYANRLVDISNQSSVSSYQYRCNGLSSDAWGIIGCESDRVSQTVNGVTTNYVLDQASGLTQVLDDGTYSYTYGIGRVSQQSGITSEYFLEDGLGSVRQLTDQSGAIALTKSYQPFGEELNSVGSGSTSYGFSGEMADSNGLIYLRARYYASDAGRFLTRDSWLGDYNRPLSLNRWNYVEGNPTNYFDPSGHITEKESRRAELILEKLQDHFNVHIERDWGYLYIMSVINPFPIYKCGWSEGKWDIMELETINDALKDLSKSMDGYGQFKNFIGPVTIEKSKNSCGRGCTPWWNRKVIFLDKGNPPKSVEISNSDNIDKWTVVHEFGHAWDRNYYWKLSPLLMKFTNGNKGKRPANCDQNNRLPGCNAAGYFYSGPPPAGSDNNFNPQEDFAESVAAYVYPGTAYTRMQAIVREDPQSYSQYLAYADYTQTSRWKFINALIDPGTSQ